MERKQLYGSQSCDNPDQAQQLVELIHEKVNMSKIEILRISPVLGVHTGPGIVGMAVVPFYLMEGLD
jgi:fatty acid-binding protein DegV